MFESRIERLCECKSHANTAKRFMLKRILLMVNEIGRKRGAVLPLLAHRQTNRKQ